MNRCRREERHSEHEQIYGKTILVFKVNIVSKVSYQKGLDYKSNQCYVKDLELYSLRIGIH